MSATEDMEHTECLDCGKCRSDERRRIVESLRKQGEGMGWMPEAFRLAAGFIEREGEKP